MISAKVSTCCEWVQWDWILDFPQNNLSIVPAEPWGCQPRAASGQHRVKAYLRMTPNQKKPEPSVRFLKAFFWSFWIWPCLNIHPPSTRNLFFVSQAIPVLADSQIELDFYQLVIIESRVVQTTSSQLIWQFLRAYLKWDSVFGVEAWTFCKTGYMRFNFIHYSFHPFNGGLHDTILFPQTFCCVIGYMCVIISFVKTGTVPFIWVHKNTCMKVRACNVFSGRYFLFLPHCT